MFSDGLRVQPVDRPFTFDGCLLGRGFDGCD